MLLYPPHHNSPIQLNHDRLQSCGNNNTSSTSIGASGTSTSNDDDDGNDDGDDDTATASLQALQAEKHYSTIVLRLFYHYFSNNKTCYVCNIICYNCNIICYNRDIIC